MKENTESSSTGFIHQFIPASTSEPGHFTFITRTGGNEEDLIPLGRELYPRAAILGPRGKVLESGSRLAEGVLTWRLKV